MNKVIKDFGSEWERFNYLNGIHDAFIKEQFKRYFNTVPREFLSTETTVAADFGAGTGRWTKELAKLVRVVHSIEPSDKAFKTLSLAIEGHDRIITHNSSIEEVTLNPNSLDFAMSLGVLHHIEDTQNALNRIFSFLKPGGMFLGYLYYNLEDKPKLYKLVWKLSDFLRTGVSRLPPLIKVSIAELISLFIYWPFSRFSFILSKFGLATDNIPLHQYARDPLYVMRNDALDRFGTRLEKRFSRDEIIEMLLKAGADPASIEFSTEEPFWCFSVSKN